MNDGESYILDRVRLAINRKGELVLSSTTRTAIRQEKDDNYTVHSMELSQHEEDDRGDEDYLYGEEDGSKPSSTNKISEFFNQRAMVQFQSGKQVIEECEKVLQMEFPDHSSEEGGKLLNFRELLSWKMPDHFCSTTSKNKQRVVAGNDGTILITNQINLYKLDFVT